jgi:hypothetical protein
MKDLNIAKYEREDLLKVAGRRGGLLTLLPAKLISKVL